MEQINIIPKVKIRINLNICVKTPDGKCLYFPSAKL